MTATENLIKTCNNALHKYECNIPPIKGVRNLSRSDLDTAILYAETYARQGSWDGLMKPRGGAAELLAKFKVGPVATDEHRW